MAEEQKQVARPKKKTPKSFKAGRLIRYLKNGTGENGRGEIEHLGDAFFSKRTHSAPYLAIKVAKDLTLKQGEYLQLYGPGGMALVAVRRGTFLGL